MSRSSATDRSFGIVPVHRSGGADRFLLVQHRAGHWGFPKGHPEDDESPVQTALRELGEETGLAVARLVEEPSFTEAYEFTKRKSGRRVLKHVTYFVGFVDDPAVTPCEEEVAATAWGDAEATRARISFPEARALFDEVRAYLAAAAA